jgi:two-component system, LuxR family, response regulator FixJ
VTSERHIYLVDDDPNIRDLLRMVLEPANFVVMDYPSAKAFLDENVMTGGCLIADIRMPEMSGLELQDELIKRGARLPVIIITGHGDVVLAVKAMRAGAIDFIEKPFDEKILLASVNRALDAGRDDRDRESEARAALALISLLTPRERQVLEQLVAGRSNKLTAYELSISPRTIEIHRARIMEKLRARRLADLVRTAIAASIPLHLPH